LLGNANEMTMDKRGGSQAEVSTFDAVVRAIYCVENTWAKQND
jgi:hypothetical protein